MRSDVMMDIEFLAEHSSDCNIYINTVQLELQYTLFHKISPTPNKINTHSYTHILFKLKASKQSWTLFAFWLSSLYTWKPFWKNITFTETKLLKDSALWLSLLSLHLNSTYFSLIWGDFQVWWLAKVESVSCDLDVFIVSTGLLCRHHALPTLSCIQDCIIITYYIELVWLCSTSSWVLGKATWDTLL